MERNSEAAWRKMSPMVSICRRRKEGKGEVSLEFVRREGKGRNRRENSRLGTALSDER